MKTSVIGTGPVGLVTAACLAEMGNHVLCFESDDSRIRLLEQGDLPIREPGLLDMLARNLQAGRLQFTTDGVLATAHGTLQVIALDTPPEHDGTVDLRPMIEAARRVGRHMGDYKVLIVKSTVPVGTADKLRAAVSGELAQRQLDLPFAVVANPEFFKEGAAVKDFMRPGRIIVGADDQRAVSLLQALYAPFLQSRDQLLVMDVRSAEFIKDAANATLAARISFMNELALLAEAAGADIEAVRRGIGSDPRIGLGSLYAGAGYGGPRFPRAVNALTASARGAGLDLKMLPAVAATNDRQKRLLADKVVARFGEDLSRHRFAVWGLSFKPGSADLHEAPSRVVLGELSRRGAALVAYDPVAMPEARRVFEGLPGLRYAADPASALDGADALIIITEWKEFKSPDFDAIKSRLKQPVVFDGRNLYDPALMDTLDIEYIGIGRAGRSRRPQ